MSAPEFASTESTPVDSILSLTSLDPVAADDPAAADAAEFAEPVIDVEAQATSEPLVAADGNEALHLDEAELLLPDETKTTAGDAELDEDALGADLAETLDDALEADPDFGDVVRSAVDRIGGEILFEIDDVPESGHVAAVSVGDGDLRRFLLVVQPKDGSPLRVEPTEDSANPLAALAESYAGLVEAFKKAA
ncbi:MAG: hypothetical protein AB7I52_10560 [Rhizobiaceae bacterium]